MDTEMGKDTMIFEKLEQEHVEDTLKNCIFMLFKVTYIYIHTHAFTSYMKLKKNAA